MTEAPDDRNKRAYELFQAALERAPKERAAFLDKQCGGDSELRPEVEALLAADAEKESHLERPAQEAVPPIITGGGLPHQPIECSDTTR